METIIQQYKEKNKKLKKEVNVLTYLLALTIIISIVSIITLCNKITVLKRELTNSNTKIFELKQENSELSVYNTKLIETTANYKDIAAELSDSITQLKNDNESLASEYDSVKEAYDILKYREELYDKYSYAIMYNGNRTELTYDQIKTAEELAKEKGVDPDMLFSIGMVESKFDSSCTTTTSTAKGYFQFLKGTGKFTYNTLMGHDDYYDHSTMATNPYTSIKMAVNYLNYLGKNRSTNYGVIKGYTGLSEPDWYIDRMNTYLSKVNKSFSDLL